MARPSLSGKVVIVTGAAGGIGQVLVRALLEHGARVAALDVKRLGAPGEANLLPLETDVSDYAARRHAVDETIARLGGLHALVNNAAIGLGAIRADHEKQPIDIREIKPANLAAFRRRQLLRRMEHDARLHRPDGRATKRPHHQRHDELRHDAARGLPSLWAMQGGA